MHLLNVILCFDATNLWSNMQLSWSKHSEIPLQPNYVQLHSREYDTLTWNRITSKNHVRPKHLHPCLHLWTQHPNEMRSQCVRSRYWHPHPVLSCIQGASAQESCISSVTKARWKKNRKKETAEIHCGDQTQLAMYCGYSSHGRISDLVFYFISSTINTQTLGAVGPFYHYQSGNRRAGTRPAMVERAGG